METCVVRLYIGEATESPELRGQVEVIRQGSSVRFASADELVRILSEVVRQRLAQSG